MSEFTATLFMVMIALFLVYCTIGALLFVVSVFAELYDRMTRKPGSDG